MQGEVRAKTAKLYVSTDHLPVIVPADGRRLIHYSYVFWSIRAALTTVHGEQVYVELEEPETPGLTPIRRNARALATAQFCEGLGESVRGARRENRHPAKVIAWAR